MKKLLKHSNVVLSREKLKITTRCVWKTMVLCFVLLEKY